MNKMMMSVGLAAALWASAAGAEAPKAGPGPEPLKVAPEAAKNQLALARDAVHRDERALSRNWKDWRAGLRKLTAQETEELRAAKAADGVPAVKWARAREIRRRYAETRKTARSRYQLGRTALRGHLHRALLELKRLKEGAKPAALTKLTPE